MSSPLRDEIYTDPTIRVAVLASARLLGDLISRALANAPDIEVIVHSTSTGDLVAAVASCKDCIVAFDGSSSASVRALSASSLKLGPDRIVVFGLSETPEDMRYCAELGVAGLVARDASFDEIIGAIRIVANGGTYVSEALSETQPNLLVAASRGSRYALTKRELEIARLIAWGYSNPAICQTLDIRPGTLKAHVHSVFLKLGVRDRSEVAGRYVDAVATSGGHPIIKLESPGAS